MLAVHTFGLTINRTKGKPMGEIVVDIHLENSGDRDHFKRGYGEESDIRCATVRAVADTGANMLALPQDVVDRLGLETVQTVTVTYANGQREDMQVAGPLTIRIGDRWMPSNCIVIPTSCDALVGQIVLEGLDLVADCRNRTLAPRPESPDRPLMRL